DYVREQESWGVREIEERASILADKAAAIWKYPQVDKAVVESLKPKKGSDGQTIWTIEERHPWIAEGGICRPLFEAIEQSISEHHPDWEQYITKYYVGYRTGGKKLRIAMMPRIGGGGRIALCLTKSVDDLVDPKGLCVDKRPTKGIGPGCPTFVNFANTSALDDIMALVDQC
ncbi:MAG: hypothetical protein PUD82_06825, partial [Coriobacteriaceae bacterium]|nr:hypothetical protein [Coriobacteriaceae bacterium]